VPVTLSIKNVPDEIAAQLRARAMKNHRSLQGELLVIIEEAVAAKASLEPTALLEKIRSFGLKTPQEAADMVRQDRDAR